MSIKLVYVRMFVLYARHACCIVLFSIVLFSSISWIVLCTIMLYCVKLFSILLYIVLSSIVLHDIILSWIILYFIIYYWIILLVCGTVLYCFVLYYIVLHDVVLKKFMSRCFNLYSCITNYLSTYFYRTLIAKKKLQPFLLYFSSLHFTSFPLYRTHNLSYIINLILAK